MLMRTAVLASLLIVLRLRAPLRMLAVLLSAEKVLWTAILRS